MAAMTVAEYMRELLAKYYALDRAREKRFHAQQGEREALSALNSANDCAAKAMKKEGVREVIFSEKLFRLSRTSGNDEVRIVDNVLNLDSDDD